ncbi:MAG: digeranylgeranylglycerophospholipid reductase [Promethearchaeota archaeon]
MAKEKFDAIVVGAGTGGATAARFLAKSGFKVALVEGKPREKIGQKVCGDAVGAEVFEVLGVAEPKGDEVTWHVKGAKLYSPDRLTCVTMVDPTQAGFLLDRLEFGQRLLNEALDAGDVTLLDYCNVTGVTFAKGDGAEAKGTTPELAPRLAGVVVKDKDRRETRELSAEVVVDASGYHPAVRKRLPPSDLVELAVDDGEDAIICFREVVELVEGRARDVDYISIYLDPANVPGGYVWYFPKGERSVNLGLGVFPSLKRSLRALYQKHAKGSFLAGQKIRVKASGGGIVSVRRPLTTLVLGNVLLVGDAGCQVNPLHGGGIDPSMRGGWMAAKAVANAHDAGNASSEEALWGYNVEFQRGVGSQFAALDVLRLALQDFTPDKLNFGLSRGLLSGEEILEVASTGGVKLDPLGLLGKALKGITKPDLLLDLGYVHGKMGEAKKLFQRYPSSPAGLPAWKKRVEGLFSGVRRTLGKNRGKYVRRSAPAGRAKRGPVFYMF